MQPQQLAKIVIAEDEAVLRAAYVTILEHASYTVIEAEDGRKAVDVAVSVRPDLLILDMLMPGKSGIEVLQDPSVAALRPAMRVIAFTNLSDSDTIDTLKQLQVEMYLLKSSVLPQMLIDTVKDVLAGKATPGCIQTDV